MLCFCCVITNGDDHPSPWVEDLGYAGCAEVWKPKAVPVGVDEARLAPVRFVPHLHGLPCV